MSCHRTLLPLTLISALVAACAAAGPGWHAGAAAAGTGAGRESLDTRWSRLPGPGDQDSDSEDQEEAGAGEGARHAGDPDGLSEQDVVLKQLGYAEVPAASTEEEAALEADAEAADAEATEPPVEDVIEVVIEDAP